ncbi:hypothetical protein GCM10010988_24770 [Cnuibacter physcomitrellae]|uniref:HYDIN/VesB/CFA65-like Ig-like domain-containing protein n=1 Tax=Cnuibacter physcomitrellae TaxID=1619308 RepID=A0A1X9LPL0_9MICO|nr:choice-of-anchor D domain-containing protein [Cnuibacter physcomitrellae]ARJ03820.1 hypothetical protein B5808_00155 [Cnuibacter physcomitrellae]GGI39578.1 hypothetical protein GCM10010988_24770 [Cnuibacter physcomitrellae]
MRARIRAGLGAAVLLVALTAAGAASAPVAQAAPGDVVLAISSTDVGPVKSGTSRSLVVTVTNTGTKSVDIDGSTLSATVTAPFSITDNHVVSGEEVRPGESREFTLTFAPVVLGAASMPISLSVAEFNVAGMSRQYGLMLTGLSIATDPASFSIVGPADGVIDVGEVASGALASATITVVNDGVLDLEFDPAGLTAITSDGASLPIVYAGAAAPSIVRPGETSSLVVTFGPAPGGVFSGTLTLRGAYAEDGKVVASAIRSLTFIGRTVAPAVTTTPPVAGSANTRGSQLASTGSDGLLLFVGGTVSAMAVLAGIAVVTARRSGRRA